MFPFPYFPIMIIFISCGSIKACPLPMMINMIKEEYAKDTTGANACYILACAYVGYEEVMKNFRLVREYCTANQGIRMRALQACQFLMKQSSSLGYSIDSARSVLTQAMAPTASKIMENIMHQSKYYEAYVGHDTMPSEVGQARGVCQHWNTVADLCYSDPNEESDQVKKACRILFN